MSNKYFIKIITGFREDQEVSIPMQEAHKAFYLFKHPEERGVFDCGIALVGRNIQEIKPDWNATMGYNETHELDSDDWNEIKAKGVEEKMRLLIENAKDVAVLVDGNKNLMKLELKEAMKFIPENAKLISENTKILSDKFKV